MNIFNIIGPRMIGPSSSHTAGAVRLGRVAYKLMNGAIPKDITIEMSGSFASTYKGHGTDRALIAGILGYHSDSPEIKDIFDIAKKANLNYHFLPTHIPDAHPNTARISFTCTNGYQGEVVGASVGGGNIRVHGINGLKVDFSGEHTTLMVLHLDRPGVIANVTNLMRNEYEDANICNFSLSRRAKGGEAIMMMELDSQPPKGIKEGLLELENVMNVFVIQAI